MNEFSLAHLTVLSLPPPEMVSVAARTGYQAVGLRLIAVTPDSPGYPLMDDAAAMRETKARLDDTGLRVGDIEFVKITPEIDIAALEPFPRGQNLARDTSLQRRTTPTLDDLPSGSLRLPISRAAIIFRCCLSSFPGRSYRICAKPRESSTLQTARIRGS